MKSEKEIKAKLEEMINRMDKELNGFGNPEMLRSYSIMVAILKWVLK